MWRSALLLLVCLLVLVLQFPGPCNSLPKEHRAAAQAKAIELYSRRPAYVYELGGNPIYGKIDCSEFVRKVLHEADIVPTSKRTQAWRFYRGLDGFYSVPVTDENHHVADLLCLRVPSSLDRPYGINHIGMLIHWKGGWAVIDANATTKGIRIMPYTGIWKKYLPDDGQRRLIIMGE